MCCIKARTQPEKGINKFQFSKRRQFSLLLTMSNILFYEPFYNFDCLFERALRPLNKNDRIPAVCERVFRPKYAYLSY